MSIEVGSKWQHKDTGEVVEVIDVIKIHVEVEKD